MCCPEGWCLRSLNHWPEWNVRQVLSIRTNFFPRPHLTTSDKKLGCASKKGGVCGLSIVAPNGTYAKYYPSGATSLSLQHLQPSDKKLGCAAQKGVLCDLSRNWDVQTITILSALSSSIYKQGMLCAELDAAIAEREAHAISRCEADLELDTTIAILYT